ncbi:MAG: type II toxin-antitoxin system HicA family toxin [Candidatus Hydrogenedentes bacterium]|nr:type II toxin-antitoxin system HicA family toxin [Candidatus Hydrogenedentota bacterium]
MKRVDLVKQLQDMNCELIRHGGRHDWYQNPRTGACQPVPRHRETNENLAKQILRRLRD